MGNAVRGTLPLDQSLKPPFLPKIGPNK